MISAKECVRKTNAHTANFKKKEGRESSNRVSQPLKHKNNHESFSKEKQQQAEGASRYQVEKKVGSGTFGTVHKARDKKTL